MADHDKTADAKSAEPKPPGGGSKLVTILMIVNSLLLAGVLAVLVLRPAGLARAKAPEPAGEHAEKAEGGEKKEEKKDEKAEGKEHGEKGEKPAAGGATVRLPDFIVHLRDADGDRYARLSFEVEVREEKGKEAITGRLPQIRDAFLAYLSDRTVDELRGSEAMAQLKEALLKRLQDVAPSAPVKALYVTDLVIQ